MKTNVLVLIASLAGACSSALAQESGRGPMVYPDQLFKATTNGNLEWDLYIPPAPFAPPWNVVLVIHEGDFHGGSRKDVDTVANELATQGFAAAAIDYRLDLVPSSVAGQTKPVFAPPAVPNQPGDVALAILAARFPTQPPLVDSTGKSLVTGWVAAVGGSTGACHALWCAATGTLRDTKPNVIALLSGPYLFTDSSSLNNEAKLGCGMEETTFAKDVDTYCQTQPQDPGRTAKLMAGSPSSLVTTSVSPLIAFSSMNDPITPSQLVDWCSLEKMDR